MLNERYEPYVRELAGEFLRDNGLVSGRDDQTEILEAKLFQLLDQMYTQGYEAALHTVKVIEEHKEQFAADSRQGGAPGTKRRARAGG
jgi:hypothetical protein